MKQWQGCNFRAAREDPSLPSVPRGGSKEDISAFHPGKGKKERKNKAVAKKKTTRKKVLPDAEPHARRAGAQHREPTPQTRDRRPPQPKRPAETPAVAPAAPRPRHKSPPPVVSKAPPIVTPLRDVRPPRPVTVEPAGPNVPLPPRPSIPPPAVCPAPMFLPTDRDVRRPAREANQVASSLMAHLSTRDTFSDVLSPRDAIGVQNHPMPKPQLFFPSHTCIGAPAGYSDSPVRRTWEDSRGDAGRLVLSSPHGELEGGPSRFAAVADQELLDSPTAPSDISFKTYVLRFPDPKPDSDKKDDADTKEGKMRQYAQAAMTPQSFSALSLTTPPCLTPGTLQREERVALGGREGARAGAGAKASISREDPAHSQAKQAAAHRQSMDSPQGGKKPAVIPPTAAAGRDRTASRSHSRDASRGRSREDPSVKVRAKSQEPPQQRRHTLDANQAWRAMLRSDGANATPVKTDTINRRSSTSPVGPRSGARSRSNSASKRPSHVARPGVYTVVPQLRRKKAPKGGGRSAANRRASVDEGEQPIPHGAAYESDAETCGQKSEEIAPPPGEEGSINPLQHSPGLRSTSPSRPLPGPSGPSAPPRDRPPLPQPSPYSPDSSISSYSRARPTDAMTVTLAASKLDSQTNAPRRGRGPVVPPLPLETLNSKGGDPEAKPTLQPIKKQEASQQAKRPPPAHNRPYLLKMTTEELRERVRLATELGETLDYKSKPLERLANSSLRSSPQLPSSPANHPSKRPPVMGVMRQESPAPLKKTAFLCGRAPASSLNRTERSLTPTPKKRDGRSSRRSMREEAGSARHQEAGDKGGVRSSSVKEMAGEPKVLDQGTRTSLVKKPPPLPPSAKRAAAQLATDGANQGPSRDTDLRQDRGGNEGVSGPPSVGGGEQPTVPVPIYCLNKAAPRSYADSQCEENLRARDSRNPYGLPASPTAFSLTSSPLAEMRQIPQASPLLMAPTDDTSGDGQTEAGPSAECLHQQQQQHYAAAAEQMTDDGPLQGCYAGSNVDTSFASIPSPYDGSAISAHGGGAEMFRPSGLLGQPLVTVHESEEAEDGAHDIPRDNTETPERSLRQGEQLEGEQAEEMLPLSVSPDLSSCSSGSPALQRDSGVVSVNRLRYERLRSAFLSRQAQCCSTDGE
ncbi:unnamed protein product [Vitrella brassicaformis CCMP3155]|uniref:Uncharacterized protein n=4 Tax=Vitrella brassicaformis TaxID=1169539 RepID=A0A0G4EXH8_VITBC|nr:unnamed protein product [Vitrella brassicaformis CCMP3155]|eukprot:CEM03294.1 unnamed protein product [Vitrella brassicaformis CCMP3155]